MSNVTTLKCDGENCGKLRVNDSNHWLYGVTTRRSIVMGFMEAAPDHDTLEKHFCGEQCATRWFIAQLTGLRENTR